MGFVAATLGSSKNKKLFVEHQDAAYPDFSSWKTGEDPSVLQKGIAEQSSQLKSVFDKQEKLACLRQELSQLVTEQEYFNQYVKESDVHTDSIKFKKKTIFKAMDGIVAGMPVDFRRENGNRILVQDKSLI